MTYVEQELLPMGFNVAESTDKKVVLSLGHLKFQFDCVCPSYPSIKTLGCPLHHSGPGDSWPVYEAKKVAAKTHGENKESHVCGFCPASYPTVEDLYAHQARTHDPDGIMFSEIGLPK